MRHSIGLKLNQHEGSHLCWSISCEYVSCMYSLCVYVPGHVPGANVADPCEVDATRRCECTHELLHCGVRMYCLYVIPISVLSQE